MSNSFSAMKKYSFFLFLFLLLAIFGSCKALKVNKLLKKGAAPAGNFLSVVPFDYSKRLPIIEVDIRGKKYNFVFDTGAPCVISTQLFEDLGLAAAVEVEVSDSNDKEKKTAFALLDSMQIGEVIFTEISAAVLDLRANDGMACLDIDGIIGANLMRTAFWEIDYADAEISFTDDLSNFSDAGEKAVLNFTQKKTGTPIFTLNANETEVKSVTFDTGSTGYVSLPLRYFPDAIPDKTRTKRGYGTLSYGVHGAGRADTSYYLRVDTWRAGEVTESGKIIEAEKIDKRLVGNMFMENYRVVLNWEAEKITLYPRPESGKENEKVETLGFLLAAQGENFRVSYLYADSEAEKKGLRVGDLITEINGQPVAEMTVNQRCTFILGFARNHDRVKVKVLRGEEMLVLTLLRRAWF